MRAVVVRSPAAQRPCRSRTCPIPSPVRRGRVEVAAAAVNRADLLQRQGHYTRRPAPRRSPGWSARAGSRSSATGSTGWVGRRRGVRPALRRRVRRAGRRPGRAAAARARGRRRWSRPRRCPRSTCTVWSQRLHAGRPAARARRCWCTAGRAASARWRSSSPRRSGARVAVTAGQPEKLRGCAELGADVLMNYREQDFVEEVRAATDGAGADVVLDIMGAEYLARNLDVLATSGRLVVIGMQGGTKAELDLGALMASGPRCSRRSLRARPAEEKAAIVAAVASTCGRCVDDGRGAAGGRPHLPAGRRRRRAPADRGLRPRGQGAAPDRRRYPWLATGVDAARQR